MKIFFTHIAILVTSSLITTLTHATTWNMPTPYPDKTFHTVNIIQFTEDVKSATNGQLKINTHSAGSLYKHPEINKAVRSGQVQIGEFFLSLLSNEHALYGADSQLFLASNYQDAKRLWEAQKPIITKMLEKQNLIPLFSVPWPPQGLYTKKPIKNINDLKGLKFRTYNSTLEKFANLSGAAATQVEVPDIPQAFMTGRVEAMITSPSTGVNSKAWDFVNYFTDIQAWVPKNIVVVNRKVFLSLDKDIQEKILTAAADAEKRGWELSQNETNEKIKILKQNGIKVMKPSAELVKGLQEIGKVMLKDWKTSATPESKEFFNTFGI